MGNRKSNFNSTFSQCKTQDKRSIWESEIKPQLHVLSIQNPK
ncbi:hypothetical protein HMPREF1981_03611 [Bacteroides pyogenes F0041]|uniref:Uncharacterized protein n=1 Tax=Bacteroides pyogenes F0041 TaxID=1321819 RepID=U2DH68_9BACE|nr:hypothetical protein HMPREF1981_03611 [Bacteroides pyogenes F0041]